MNVKTLWKVLKTLVECDQKIFEAQDNVSQISKKVENNRILISQIESALEEKKQNLASLDKRVKREEIHAEELKDKEEKERKVLDSITNEKELKAFKKELRVISEKRNNQEDELMKAWNDLENSKKSLETSESEYTEKIKTLNEEIQQLQASTKEFEDSIQKNQKERDTIAKDVPEEWLVRYERMKHNVSNPIVAVMHGSCTACYYSVTTQDMYKLQKAGIIPCRSCYRFLYFDQEEETENAQASY